MLIFTKERTDNELNTWRKYLFGILPLSALLFITTFQVSERILFFMVPLE